MNITNYVKNMEVTFPSFVLDMPNDVYHAEPNSISKSGLDLVARSPAHYKFRKFSEPTRAMEIGTAIHTALLEPERFASEYVLLKDVKDRRASEFKDAAKIHGSERVLTADESANVSGMFESVYAQKQAKYWLEKAGYREASLFAIDPVTGVGVRCRYDILTKCGNILDLKKTQDARYESFEKSIFNYKYYVQAAFYLDCWEWATGEKLDSFRIIAVEENLPHAAMVYKIDDTAIAEGRKQYREALNIYADCLASNDWSCYPCSDNEVIGLPEWYVRRLENELEVTLTEEF